MQGPTANKLNVPGNPFVIDGNPDPNANKPGDGKSPPAMTINGSPGGSSTEQTAPSQGGPVTANSENNSPPASRWGIVQKYFGGGSQQSQPSQQPTQNP